MQMDVKNWKRIRRKVLKRDGYICQVAGCPVRGGKNLTVHHILPRARGGGENLDNLITLCPRHHDEIESASVLPVNRAQIIGWPGLEEWEAEHSQKRASRIILDAFPAPERGEDRGDIGSGQKTGRLPKPDTVVAVQELYGRLGSWAVVARDLHQLPGYAAVLSSVAREIPGAISEEEEAELRYRLAKHFGYRFPELDFRPELAPRPEPAKARPESPARSATAETARKLAEHKQATGRSWREIAAAWGFPPSFKATLSRVARGGPVSIETENSIRERLGLPPLPQLAPAPICPTCGVPHVLGDCRGKLRDGGRIIAVTRRKPRPLPPGLERAVAWLDARQAPRRRGHSRRTWKAHPRHG